MFYVFSSENLTNVWAAVGAKLWAVSKAQGTSPQNITKSQKITVGEYGISYIKETKSFTTPFIFRSIPKANETILNIWSAEWYLPFSIIPLGSPHISILAKDLNKILPSLIESKNNWDKLLFVAPNLVFARTKCTKNDMAVLIETLTNE